MSVKLTEDIRPVTDLKRNARKILDQIHKTGRPVILTTNGRADAVILDAKTYEKHLKASNIGRLLAAGEEDIAANRVSSMRSFLHEFKRAHKISR
jgi:prevent-host-death family protein